MLNQLQEKAIHTNERFLFLLAGAGTGKTTVIVERIKRLITQGKDPSKILAITFTNRASKEMKKRIKNENVAIHTFHQFCYQKLKTQLSYDENIIQEDLPFNDDDLLKIATDKNSNFKTKKPKMFDKYQAFLNKNKSKDFDDLLIDFHYYFHKIKDGLEFDYIFVDEFQDTNLLQYKIIKKLVGKHSYLFCVGDPDQSIYRFRGAYSKIIDTFIKDYHAKCYQLNINYRSTKNILTTANSVIKRNNNRYKKTLITDNNDGDTVHLMINRNMNDENNRIISLIKTHQKKGIVIHEIAILFRNYSRVNYLKKALIEQDFYMDNQENKNGIKLLTLHQAKGLEFSVVFIIGLEKGMLPSYHTKTLLDLEEERRLFFVGITRAKHVLYLSYCQSNNDAKHLHKSSFLNELNRYFKHRRIIIKLHDV